MIRDQKSPELFHGFTKESHIRPQSFWIPRDAWLNTVVIRYQSDMESQLKRFLEYTGKPQTGHLPFRNVSRGPRETLDGDDLTWIREYYRADFELWDAVNEHPELFKKVI
jgi:hypothetical protein